MGGVLSRLEPVPNPDRVTGEQRRDGRMGLAFLPSKPKSPLLPSDEELLNHVDVESGLIELGSRGQCFWMTIVPKDFDRVRQVIVFHHGAGEHVGCHYQNELLTFAHLHGAACIGFDMLGHGRSDGLHMMVESWDSYVDWAVAFNDTFVPPKVKEWSARLEGRELKVFATGESLGGGVLAALCLLSPERFAGVILTGPMLGIEDEIRPHPIIESVLVHIVAPLLPTWPITPGGGEDSMLLACRDPEAAKDMFYSNDYGGNVARLRLSTAVQLGIVGCGWIQKRLTDFSTPFLVIHAGDDRITSPAMSRKLHEVAVSKDKTLRILDGAWHAEVFQGGPSNVDLMLDSFDFVATWLNDRTP
eukprot:m.23237 g.23237  ORF g.23237 m.23237 type:complete len:359 (+) comp10946_c0_seq2:32-1108(+)